MSVFRSALVRRVCLAAVLLLAGVRLLRPPGAVSRTGPAAWFGQALAPAFALVRGAERSGGPFALGAATGLLPCGIVYVAAIQGAALGTPLGGAALMAAFGVGTVPVLAAVGLLGHGAVARFGPARLGRTVDISSSSVALYCASGWSTVWNMPCAFM